VYKSSQDEEPDVLGELVRREPIFHRPELGTTRADFERMMAPDFWEIGASGRRYDRAYVLDELDRRYAVPSQEYWETSDFDCRRLAENIYLLTYVLVQEGGRRSRRATIWRRLESDWQILFHQGTLIEKAE